MSESIEASPANTGRSQGLDVLRACAIACWSYSIYLTHKAVAHVLHQRLPGFGISPMLEFVCITAACILVGAALYRAVELPFMKLRKHWFPDRSVSRDLPT